MLSSVKVLNLLLPSGETKLEIVVVGLFLLHGVVATPKSPFTLNVQTSLSLEGYFIRLKSFADSL